MMAASIEQFRNAFVDAQVKHIKKGFKAHVISYICMNTIMVIVNVLTSTEHMWSMYSIAGWGFGVVMHYFSQVMPAKKSLNKISDEVMAQL